MRQSKYGVVYTSIIESQFMHYFLLQRVLTNFALKIKSTLLVYLQYYTNHRRDREQCVQLVYVLCLQTGPIVRGYIGYRSETFWCEVDRLRDSVLDVDLSQMEERFLQ